MPMLITTGVAVYLNKGNNEPICDDAQKACVLGNCKILEAIKVRGYYC
jgi:hypothetical protein